MAIKKDIYDLIIVGAGPAGLAGAVYAARYQLKVLIIGQIPGGIAGTAHKVCNFPSYPEIKGMELMMKMIEQVKKNKVEIKQEIVENIQKENDLFEIKTNKEEYATKKVILAMGTKRRKLGIKDEEKFIGKGVSYCATCDAGFYKGKIVGVVGGSDAALTAALLLANISKKVYLIYRKSDFVRAEQAWVKQVSNNKKIQVLFDTEVKTLLGDEKISGIEVETKNKKQKIDLEGIFIEIGSVPNTKLAQKLGLTLEKIQIKVDKEQKTNVEGIFAAGDITNNVFKQIVTACAEGSIAAYVIYKELKSEE